MRNAADSRSSGNARPQRKSELRSAKNAVPPRPVTLEGGLDLCWKRRLAKKRGTVMRPPAGAQRFVPALSVHCHTPAPSARVPYRCSMAGARMRHIVKNMRTRNKKNPPRRPCFAARKAERDGRTAVARRNPPQNRSSANGAHLQARTTCPWTRLPVQRAFQASFLLLSHLVSAHPSCPSCPALWSGNWTNPRWRSAGL